MPPAGQLRPVPAARQSWSCPTPARRSARRTGGGRGLRLQSDRTVSPPPCACTRSWNRERRVPAHTRASPVSGSGRQDHTSGGRACAGVCSSSTVLPASRFAGTVLDHDRKRVGKGKRVSVRVANGGGRISNKKNKYT